MSVQTEEMLSDKQISNDPPETDDSDIFKSPFEEERTKSSISRNRNRATGRSMTSPQLSSNVNIPPQPSPNMSDNKKRNTENEPKPLTKALSPLGETDKVKDGLVLYSKNFQILIRGGTLEKIIERLTNDSAPDTDFVDTFLLTYRTYLTPSEVLNRVFNRYDIPPNTTRKEGNIEVLVSHKIVRLRIGNFIKRWLSNHFHDFAKDMALIEQVKKLVNSTIMVHDEQLGKNIEGLIEEQLKNYGRPPTVTLQNGLKNIKAPVLKENATFKDFDADEFARQLCLYEHDLFRQIHPKECLNQCWNKEKEKAPNIMELINFTNKLTSWVATQVVTQAKYQDRVNYIKKFMKIALKCKEYNNFNACQEIVSGLVSSAVYRMKKSWLKVKEDKKLYQSFNELKDLISSTGNYKTYRKILKTLNPPSLPYLGVYLTDLTFIEDGNPDYLPNTDMIKDMINFEKCRQVATVIREIMLHQQQSYNFPIVNVIYNSFNNLEYMSENDRFKKSREVETKEETDAAAAKEEKMNKSKK